MNGIILILFMMAVGALVGAATNLLAIRMLFRPYRAYKIGRLQVPFTPGLLPKRQQDLSVQLGRIFGNHLLTAEGLGEKLGATAFVTEMTMWAQKAVRHLLQSEESVAQLLETWLHVDVRRERLAAASKIWLQEKLTAYLQAHEHTSVDELLPPELKKKVTEFLPGAVDMFLEKAKKYVDSAEGQAALSNMVARFLTTKGKLGSMVKMFISQEKLVDMLTPEIQKFLADARTKEMAENFLQAEWDKLCARQLASFQLEPHVAPVVDNLIDTLEGEIPALDWLDAPLCTWTAAYEEKIVSKWIPNIVRKTLVYIQKQVTPLLQKLQLDKVIEAQVATLSMPQLEALILAVTKRELQMITYFGGLIGGIVGLFQALVVQFFY